ncbi:MAG: hypothetical protein J6R82_03835, partial [Clostridia bacterium]|nr:hypothetical protein [Clostridia bacterium]
FRKVPAKEKGGVQLRIAQLSTSPRIYEGLYRHSERRKYLRRLIEVLEGLLRGTSFKKFPLISLVILT